MGNEGIFELELKDAAHQPAHDERTRVRFFRASDNDVIAESNNLTFPPARRFTLPAFPQERNLYCEAAPSRFRMANTGLFTLNTVDVRSESVTALKLPDKWEPQFVLWNSLSGEFNSLKDVLDRSPSLKVKGGESFDNLVGDTYDSVTTRKAVLAKMALLNLYFTLTIIKEPINQRNSWFSFVERIFLIDRERFMAFVNPQMGTIVRTIKDDISRFPNYKHTNALNHFDGIQAAIPPGYRALKSKMFSVKTKPDHANIQLTMAPTRDPDGNEVMVLDADIDENGQLLAHLADLIKHKITGGTHPIDIHEYLVLAYGDVAFGYDLI